MQRGALCRSRRELSNAYLLAKFGFDTAENEPSKVCPIEPSRSHGAEGGGGTAAERRARTASASTAVSCIEAKFCKKILV